MAGYSSSNQTICGICCETFNKSTRIPITCPRADCGWEACKTCVRTFILGSPTDPSCMKCFHAWDIEFVINELNRSFWIGEYRTHRKEMLLEAEMSKLPDTMVAAKQYKQVMDLEIESDKYRDRIKMYKDAIIQLNNDISWNNRRIYRLRRAIREGNDADDTENSSKKKFLMKCSYDDCRGYLSTQYKCEICEKYTCSKCLEPIGLSKDNNGHICNEDNVKSAELVKKETKPCPNCTSRIYKIDGCDQMFCTTCHSAFSWKTGNIIKGVIHNPHYYEWQRQISETGEAPRAVGDVPCGGLINHIQYRHLIRDLIPNNVPISLYRDVSYSPEIKMMYEFRRELNRIHRMINHATHVCIPGLTQRIDETTDHKYFRIDYILNIITKEQLQDAVYKQDNIRAKCTALRNIWQVFELCGIEFFENVRHLVYNSEDSKKEKINTVKGMIQQIRTFTEYCNKLFANVSVTWGHVVPKIDNNFYEITTKYKKMKPIKDGSCGGGDHIVEIVK